MTTFSSQSDYTINSIKGNSIENKGKFLENLINFEKTDNETLEETNK